MSTWRYILVSLRQYARVHAAVAAGVAVATAVITGALLVGDSVRGSLRDLALAGLGRIDAALVAEQPFRAALASEWKAGAGDQLGDAVPLLLVSGALSHDDAGKVRRATHVQVVGVGDDFWSLAASPQKPPIQRGNQVALAADLADELGVKVGDSVVVRLPAVDSMPADSTLGEKEGSIVSRRLKVTAILPPDDDGLARFTLRPSQTPPRNAFIPLKTLQEILGLSDAANVISLTSSATQTQPLDAVAIADLKRSLHPTLEDFGLVVDAPDSPALPYVFISAKRLVLPPAAVAAARKLYGNDGLQPTIVYLANRIAAGEKVIPYSIVAGVDSTAALGPVRDDAGQPLELADDEVTLNDWTAERLGLKVGDSVAITWYDPETTHGELREHAPLKLKVRAIVPLASAEGAPTAAADPGFAPPLPGVTDQESIDAWDLPFELVEKIGDDDEAYWEQHRTTPKAFISHALATKLWATRWGTESVLRVPKGTDRSVESVSAALRHKLDPAQMGMSLLPVRQQALAAAAGTTPFDGLFLGFSFFLMASAIMLVALLFRLGVEQRAREVGLLLATGTTPQRVRRLLLGEAAIVAAAGAALGVLGGAAYARLMIHGLNTWWNDALAAPFLRFHANPASWAIGFAAGMIVALGVMAWSLRRLAKLPARQLLAGDSQAPLSAKPAARWSRSVLPASCLLLAIALGAAAVRWEGEAQAGAFFGSGALVLIGLLAAVRGKLREPTAGVFASLTLAGLAARNARRNPTRTMLSLALAATASFLIVALSAFRLAPTDLGTGGFDIVASSDLPLHSDLMTVEGRSTLGFTSAVNQKLRGTEVVGFRVRDGEDASCLNLYQTSQPRILGAPTALLSSYSKFAWATSDASLTPGDESNPWTLLDAQLGDADDGARPIPMALDRNTAFYSLKLYALGDQLKIRDAANRAVPLQIVGLLANSILQGDAIISASNFLRLFPETAGERFFLIRRGPKAPMTPQFIELLETQLEDYGFDAVDARARLADLLAVQNTYLSTFQSLGALGLLLGAVGLAVAQVRSVLERRGELALLQAAGFPRRRLLGMVILENLVLLLGGLAIGCIAALVAVLPHAIIEHVGAPWQTLAVLLALVAAAGALAAWLAARSALAAPLLTALRGD